MPGLAAESFLLGHFLSRVALGHVLRLPRSVIGSSEDVVLDLLTRMAAPSTARTRAHQLAAGLFAQLDADLWEASLSEAIIDPDMPLGAWVRSDSDPRSYPAMRLGFAVFGAITIVGAAVTDAKAQPAAAKILGRCITAANELDVDTGVLSRAVEEIGRTTVVPSLVTFNRAVLINLGGSHLAHCLAR